MSESKHTPGPWEAEYSDYGDEIWFGGSGCGMWAIRGPDACYLAGCAERSPAEKATAESNARLIAAAPRLLQACRGLVSAVNLLISESDGVAGLHLNGEIAEWNQLTAGGRFEEWLLPLEDATAAIQLAEPTT